MHEAQIMSHLRIFYCYLDMFTIAENPAFFPGYYPYTLPPEFSKNPRVSLRPKRQCSFISPLEGAGKDTLCSVCFHCLYCCSIATEMALQAVLIDLCSQDVLAFLDSCLHGDPH